MIPSSSMVLTVKFVQVNLEFACHVGDLLDVMLLDTYSAFLIKHLLMLRQSNGSLEGVSDFSAVEVEISDCWPFDVLFGAHSDADTFHAFPAQFLDEGFPDLLAVVILQGWIVKLDMDARGESIVEGADAVGREEKHAFESLEGAKKAGDEAIAVEIVV